MEKKNLFLVLDGFKVFILETLKGEHKILPIKGEAFAEISRDNQGEDVRYLYDQLIDVLGEDDLTEYRVTLLPKHENSLCTVFSDRFLPAVSSWVEVQYSENEVVDFSEVEGIPASFIEAYSFVVDKKEIEEARAKLADRHKELQALEAESVKQNNEIGALKKEVEAQVKTNNRLRNDLSDVEKQLASEKLKKDTQVKLNKKRKVLVLGDTAADWSHCWCKVGEKVSFAWKVSSSSVVKEGDVIGITKNKGMDHTHEMICLTDGVLFHLVPDGKYIDSQIIGVISSPNDSLELIHEWVEIAGIQNMLNNVAGDFGFSYLSEKLLSRIGLRS